LDFGLGFDWFGFAQFNHHLEILELLLRLEQRLDFIAERIGFVDDLLRLLATVPEGFPRHQSGQFRYPFLRARDVKETSADARVSQPPSKFPP
jgi:hypothetical protein